MEIRCRHCQHVGPAAAVRPGEQGVELICEACGQVNLLEMGGGGASAPARPPEQVASAVNEAPAVPVKSTPPVTAPRVAMPAAAAPVERESLLSERALERLIPEPGDGLRCRKCANKLESWQDNCPRCGLGVEEAFRFPPGQAPWEVAPKGSEQAHDRAMLLWEAAREQWSEERVTRFTEFVRDEGFHETGIRLLRFYLVDHPNDEVAIAALYDLASRLQSRLIVARAQAEVSAQNFSSGIKRTRAVLTGGVLLVWGVIFLLFLTRFVDNCG